jgi:hypothetical protein
LREEIEASCLQQMGCIVAFPRQHDLRQQMIHACLEFWSTYTELPQLRKWWGEC